VAASIVSLQVIGAGLGRTGTMSLQLALERLGFAPCDHMINLVDDPERVTLWLEATRRKAAGDSRLAERLLLVGTRRGLPERQGRANREGSGALVRQRRRHDPAPDRAAGGRWLGDSPRAGGH
jgi:hypothetical protein